MLNFSADSLDMAIRKVSKYLEHCFNELSQSQPFQLKGVKAYWQHKGERYAQWSKQEHGPFFLSSTCEQLNQLLSDYQASAEKSVSYSLQVPKSEVELIQNAYRYFQERLHFRTQLENSTTKSRKKGLPITLSYSFKKPREGHHSQAYLRGVTHAKTLLGALKSCDQLDALLVSPNGQTRFKRSLKKESTFSEFIKGGMDVFEKALRNHTHVSVKPSL